MPYKDKEKYRENHNKWLKEDRLKHPEKYKEMQMRYKTWIIRNCIVCGRFLRKHQYQYCSECSKEIHYPDTEADYYQKNREKTLERVNKRNRELREILSKLPSLFL